jgi:DtxR family Mn-dependent transcriptional regulator
MNTTKLAVTNTGGRRASAGEDYLEAILRLEQLHGWARVGELAAMLNVHKSTVTATLKGLAGRGLVTHKRYAAAQLTPAGLAVAARTTARHALLHDFLVSMLLLDDVVADANACRMEHIVDADVASRLELLARFTAAQPGAVARWGQSLRTFMEAESHAAPAAGGGAA